MEEGERKLKWMVKYVSCHGLSSIKGLSFPHSVQVDLGRVGRAWSPCPSVTVHTATRGTDIEFRAQQRQGANIRVHAALRESSIELALMKVNVFLPGFLHTQLLALQTNILLLQRCCNSKYLRGALAVIPLPNLLLQLLLRHTKPNLHWRKAKKKRHTQGTYCVLREYPKISLTGATVSWPARGLIQRTRIAVFSAPATVWRG